MRVSLNSPGLISKSHRIIRVTKNREIRIDVDYEVLKLIKTRGNDCVDEIDYSMDDCIENEIEEVNIFLHFHKYCLNWLI